MGTAATRQLCVQNKVRKLDLSIGLVVGSFCETLESVCVRHTSKYEVSVLSGSMVLFFHEENSWRKMKCWKEMVGPLGAVRLGKVLGEGTSHTRRPHKAEMIHRHGEERPQGRKNQRGHPNSRQSAARLESPIRSQ